MRNILKLFIILFLTQSVVAQEEAGLKRTVLKKSYIGLGGVRNSFQDAKFSYTQYLGTLIALNIGTSRETDKYFWEIDFNGDFTKLSAKTHPFVAAAFHGRLDFTYARKDLSFIHLDGFRGGGKWTVADVNFINFSDLGNNGLNFISSSRIAVFGEYKRKINDNLSASFSLAVGLFGLFKEFKSFAYTAPQNVLENGKFDFQDNGTQSPFSLKYYQFKTIGKLNSIETNLQLNFKKIWSFYYQWNLFNYTTVKRYPLTIAQHIVGARFNFIVKTKKRFQKQ